MPDADDPTIVIIDAASTRTEPYETWLDDYDTRTVDSPTHAGEAVNDGVDIVLLDRTVPTTDEATVLADIRARDLDCRVVLITETDPGVDILERGFDAYITKPVDRDTIRESVARLLDRVTLDEELTDYYELIARRTDLETTHTESELADHEEYHQLLEKIESHEDHVDETAGDLSDDTEFVETVREIDENPPQSGGETDE